MPFVIVCDEAFALSKHMLGPYTNRNLSVQQRIYNYRLTRARRMVEYAFGILANNWRIFHRPLDVTPQFCDTMVKASCILHNFVHRNDGYELEDTLCESNFERILATGTTGNSKGKHVRCYFAKYFYATTQSSSLGVRWSMIWNLTYPEKVLTFVNYH